jgi:hypothetical protein
VSSLLAGAVRDVDPGPPAGLAVVGASTLGGHWQYALGAGGWNDLPAVTTRGALLLGPNDRLRFVPDAGFRGAAQLSYRAWDQTTGAAGGTADVTAKGNTVFSSATEIALAYINTAPVMAV